ncbi:MAG: FecR family protein [Janthinobacterium lividum]
MNQRLKYIYQQYIDNQCSEEELQELKTLFNQPENEQHWFDLLDDSWDINKHIPLQDVTKDKADEVYLSIISHRKIRKKPNYQWIGIAAMLLVMLGFGLYLYSTTWVNHQSENNTLKTASKPFDVLSNISKAVLTLENGNKIILDDAQNGKLASQKDVNIQKFKSSLVYNTVKSSTENATLFSLTNTISIPRGGQYQLTLVDGTKVFLNAASELTYPVKFSGAERVVTLKGEAYFEVAKNPKMPFKVNVDGRQQVEVLGTHFDVKAYADDATVNTTLLEGSVKILAPDQSAVLKPGQIAINQPNKKLLVKIADLDEVMAWKNGVFIFNNENIISMMQQISRWYNVDVVFEGNMRDINFTGNYSRTKSLNNLLKNIELINKVHFKTNGRSVIVMAK